MLLARAVLAFLTLPGIVAFLVPWMLASDAASPWPLAAFGLATGAVGTAGLLVCVRHFLVAGRGTLAPWDPPTELVRSGPYRWSRNPMYLSVLVVLGGWIAWRPTAGLALYAGLVAVVFHIRVVAFEEPFLAARYGMEWERYRGRVPRWIGRRRPQRENPRQQG